jgi:hypothetical protein
MSEAATKKEEKMHNHEQNVEALDLHLGGIVGFGDDVLADRARSATQGGGAKDLGDAK